MTPSIFDFISQIQRFQKHDGLLRRKIPQLPVFLPSPRLLGILAGIVLDDVPASGSPENAAEYICKAPDGSERILLRQRPIKGLYVLGPDACHPISLEIGLDPALQQLLVPYISSIGQIFLDALQPLIRKFLKGYLFGTDVMTKFQLVFQFHSILHRLLFLLPWSG